MEKKKIVKRRKNRKGHTALKYLQFSKLLCKTMVNVFKIALRKDNRYPVG